MDITDVCAYLRNYFPPAGMKLDKSYIHSGEYTIGGGNIAPLDFIKKNQYFRIVGSDLNDGVYQNTESNLKLLQDETFVGEIWEMSVPRGFLKLCEEIQAWRDTNEKPDSQNMSPFASESFGGYSYSKGAGSTSSGISGSGGAVTWQSVYASLLAPYRRL